MKPQNTSFKKSSGNRAIKAHYQRIRIACSNNIAEAFANFLSEKTGSGLIIESNGSGDRQILTAYFQRDAGSALSVQEIENYFKSVQIYFDNPELEIIGIDHIQAEDWLAGWKKTFVPIHIAANIVVRPTWETYQIQPGEIEIIIDPKMAFGTGHHETTAQCLEALKTIGVQGYTLLDYGCGTGILSIAAGKLGAAKVIAVDNDEEAIICAAENFKLNKIEAELIKAERFVADPPCDIIAANLTVGQIMGLERELNMSLKPDGKIIFSGIPIEDRDKFADFMAAEKYKTISQIMGSEWVSFIAAGHD